MDIGILLKKNREAAGLTIDEIAQKTALSPMVIEFIEDPQRMEKEMITLFADALHMTPEQFKGEEPLKPPQPPVEEERAESVKKAKFPSLREFILDASLCEDNRRPLALLNNESFSLLEQEIVQYLAITALYHFCDTNTSSFAFDEYVFKLHQPLLAKFKKELESIPLSPDEKEQRRVEAGNNIFACDSIENIAIAIRESFAQDLEKKLQNSIFDFEEELDIPFFWSFDEAAQDVAVKTDNEDIKYRFKLSYPEKN